MEIKEQHSKSQQEGPEVTISSNMTRTLSPIQPLKGNAAKRSSLNQTPPTPEPYAAHTELKE